MSASDARTTACAWCRRCRGLRPFQGPLPPLDVRRIPLHAAATGRPVGLLVVTLRTGRCAGCAAPIYRVGGTWRTAAQVVAIREDAA